jgi:hypothetical protein
MTYHPRHAPELGRRKLNAMSEPSERTERDERPESHSREAGSGRTDAPWWSLDPGDTHDKGERSLCVGEAA